MLDSDLNTLREQAYFRPVIFEQLPPQFTMATLHQAYEKVFQTTFDRRNFSRKMLTLGVIEPVGQEPADCGHRPATLYRFNPDAYNKLKQHHPVQFEF